MKRTTLPCFGTVWALALVASQAGAGVADAAAGDPAADPEVQGALAVVDAWLDATRAYDDVPGLSVGVVHDQSLVWSQGYGFANLEERVPADVDTIYSICSISKLFTSLAVMQLRDAGELRLSDPIEDHLDWFDIRRAHPGSAAVTVESLLTHSSGLPRESEFGYWSGPEFPFPEREQMIERLAEQETLYPAQRLFQYSNLAMSLLGEIVEARAGASYEEVVRRRILEPLGLDDTRPRYPEELRGGQLAIGYTGFDRSRARDPVPPFFTRAITAAAGFTSTVRDLAAFASWQFRLLDEEREPGETEVLAANTLREMQRVHWMDPDWETTWGLGFNVRRDGERTLVGHSGGCPGYITQFLLWPKGKMAVIVLTNAGDGPAGRLASGVLKTLAPALEKAAEADGADDAKSGAAEETEDGETAPDWSAYEGNYRTYPWGGERAVRQWGDQLVMIGLPADELRPIRLEHVEAHTFVRLTEDGERREKVTFEMGDDGRAARVVVHGNPSTRIALDG